MIPFYFDLTADHRRHRLHQFPPTHSDSSPDVENARIPDVQQCYQSCGSVFGIDEIAGGLQITQPENRTIAKLPQHFREQVRMRITRPIHVEQARNRDRAAFQPVRLVAQQPLTQQLGHPINTDRVNSVILAMRLCGNGIHVGGGRENELLRRMFRARVKEMLCPHYVDL